MATAEVACRGLLACCNARKSLPFERFNVPAASSSSHSALRSAGLPKEVLWERREKGERELRRNFEGPKCATGRQGGFGAAGKRGKESGLTAEKDLKGWTQVFPTDSLEEGKNKAAIVNGKGYVVVNLSEMLLAVDANCPACSFPLIEGKVKEDSAKVPTFECPLCRSEFSLLDGAVVEWCPKKGPLTFFIGALKENADREKMKVYSATRSEGGYVYVSLK